MKKLSKLILSLIIAAAILTGCSQAETKTVNKAPSLVGIKDIQCIVNTTVDFLDGIAALDVEDGDITPKLGITVTPEVAVENGYATFSEVGEYVVNYTITDSQGRTTQKNSYVDVVDREVEKTFVMPEGFSVLTEGAATVSKCGMINNEFVINAAGGEIAEDMKLVRSFTLSTDLEYTFRYKLYSNASGKIRATADGDECAEMRVSEGENELTFKHTVKKVGDEDKRNVEIAICFGSLENVEWIVKGVEYEYPQEAGKLVELAENFSFTGRVVPRIDNDNGNNDLKGNAWSENGGEAARLEITDTCVDIWRGGMFINTEIMLRSGVGYTISFDIESTMEADYEVIIQRGQWDEYKFETLYTPKGSVSREIVVNDLTAGALWIYVQSGTNVNTITLTNLSVKERLEPTGKDTFAIEDFSEFHNDKYDCTFTSDRGNFSYVIKNFSNIDNEHTITSPKFFVSGSGGNYVISFTAKATAPIEMIIAAPVAGGWDPTLMWQKVTLSEEETVFTFFGNGNASDRNYTLVWQFGSAANQTYENVTIEISNIKISLKNHELDN